jgi:starch phosphorylase
MQPIFHFNVIPKLPASLEPLRELAFNLWWSWEPSARRIFRQIDIDLWERVNHSPLRMLQLARQGRLEELGADDDFLRQVKAIHRRFRDYLARTDTFGKSKDNPLGRSSVAYFSAEFGFHESFPNYSGGLGILSGDHCKSASDLDLNFCAFSLLYRHGYFRQEINRDGWQTDISLNQNFHHLPIQQAEKDGRPLVVSVPMLDREVFAKVWVLAVGRVNLYLLDTDIPENTQEDRLITAQLYGGDLEMRIRQEILLGIGGVRALDALGIHPDVFHMNEGHSAFLSLERIVRLVRERKMDFYSALQIVAASNVFTTHTPVPAGNDAFPRDLMRRYFKPYADTVGLDFDRFFQFGQESVNPADAFSMTILALRTSRHANGVSALHGRVSQGLWADVWAGVPQHEVPVGSVTNGVHTKTWVAEDFSEIYDRYLGNDWTDRLTDADFWRGVIDIPDEVLWTTHQKLKGRLIDFIRERIRQQRVRLGESPEMVRRASEVLHPEILTVGFARRFATYKRGTLLFSQPERLLKLLADKQYPVQFVFAGKSHPRDEGGKKLIQEVYRHTRREGFEGRMVFVEDYDHCIGRRLYQGVDLWLNNPLRPLEASGTSGMKCPPNGGLNLSVLDGWWCEGYNQKNGWAIGADITEGSEELQNEVDTNSLFHLLETQIVPLYYAKPDGRLPVAWIQLMRESIRSVLPVFNTERMVTEYTRGYYAPAARGYRTLTADNGRPAISLSEWKRQMREDWPRVHIWEVLTAGHANSSVTVGDKVVITAKVHLGPVDPANVRVQVYYGSCSDGVIDHPGTLDFQSIEKLDKDGNYLCKGEIPASESGAYGFNVRVIPHHPHLTQPHELRLITWAKA